MATNRKPGSKRSRADQSLADRVKDIEARVNANRALVNAIKEGHKADLKNAVRAKNYFERRLGRSSPADVSIRVRDESMRVNVEFAAFERDPDAHD